ncbi:ferredoxin--NADP reductase [Ectothiorhodospiraceae bacterium 2226]|nr:ferredoxin--NADP reductase [Ectothiorhodospiraceae bacterium 2226]
MPYREQSVTGVRRWSDHTFTFTTTRPDDLAFENGEFVTIGLRPEGKLIARAYSIVSTNDDDYLEFLSIHVPDGPLTSRLAQVREGDTVWVNTKATGSLTVGHVRPGRNLYMLATGTGLAPFISLVRGKEVYEAFERVILVHSVRTVAELAYREELQARAGDRLRYVPTVTREPAEVTQRGADLFRSGELFDFVGLPPADPEQDRVMLCGNPTMNREMSEWLNAHGWTPTNYKGVGNYTVEQAFVLHHA